MSCIHISILLSWRYLYNSRGESAPLVTEAGQLIGGDRRTRLHQSPVTLPV